MPREIWDEGRVVGLSVYELYVKQHLAEDPDTPVATEREWLASSLGMGSSMILKFPNTRSNQTDYDDEYIDVPLPQGSKLAAANSIVATFFDGDITVTNMLDDYWAKRVDNYGTGIRNSYDPSGGVSYRLKNIKLSDMLDDLGYTFVRYNDIPTDAWSNPPTYIQDNDGIKYICLGKQCGYSVGSEIELNQNTGNIEIIPNELFIISHGNIDFSHKYLRFIAQHDIWKPQQILWDNTVIHIDADMSVYHNYGVEQFGEGIYLRITDNIYAVVSYSEADRYIDGTIHTDDIDEIPTYPEGMTSMSPGELLDPNLKLTRDRLSDYLKIEDGIVIQPGTWSECEFNPPASDFEVNLKERPVIRFRVRGKITNNPYILLTGFTVRYVLCGTLGQDTSTNTESPQDGDFLGPAVFPWCNKVLFTVPDQYVTLFEKNYLNTSINSLNYNNVDISVGIDSVDSSILSNKPVLYFIQNDSDEYEYFKNNNTTDKNLFIQGENDGDYLTRKRFRSPFTLNVSDYSTLNEKQSIFLIHTRNNKFPPSLYSGVVNKLGDTEMYPVDVSAPGTVKMIHETSYNETKVPYGKRKDAPYEVASEYESYYPGTNALIKKYEDGTLWTIDNRKVASTDTYDDSTIPVSKVDNYNMYGYAPKPAAGTNVDLIYDPKSTETSEYPKGEPIKYKVVSSGRDSISALPAGAPGDETEEHGVQDSYYMMSTSHSSILESDDHSDNDFINWYDLIRALSGNRKIDLLGYGLRNFKKSLEDGDNNRVLDVYKTTITPYGSSYKDAGPGDMFRNWGGSLSSNSNNIFKKIKLDVMGYSQRYNDGVVSQGKVSTRTHNYITTLSLFVGDDVSFAFNPYTWTRKTTGGISGITASDDVSIYSSNITLSESPVTVGVNAWIQRIIIRNKTSIYNILKLIRQMYQRTYYNGEVTINDTSSSMSFEINDTNGSVIYNRGGTLQYDSTTGNITISWHTGDVFSWKGSGKNHPSVGYTEWYATMGDVSVGGGSLIMFNCKNISSSSYKITISWGVLQTEERKQPKTLVFTGSTSVYNSSEHAYDISRVNNSHYYLSNAQITFVLDVQTLLASGLITNWASRIDEIENPEEYFEDSLSNSDGIYGYVYGKGSANANWVSIGDTVVSGSLTLSRIGINDSDYKSKGTLEIKASHGGGYIQIG